MLFGNVLNFEYNGVEYICDYNPDYKTKNPVTISQKGVRENGTNKRKPINEKKIGINKKDLLKALKNKMQNKLNLEEAKTLTSFFKIYTENCKNINACIF